MTIPIIPLRALFIAAILVLAVGCRAHWDGKYDTVLLVAINNQSEAWELHISTDEGKSYSVSTSGVRTKPVLHIPCHISGKTGSDEVTVYLGDYQILLIQGEVRYIYNRISIHGRLSDLDEKTIVVCELLNEDFVHDQ